MAAIRRAFGNRLSRRKKLGEILVEEGYLSLEQLEGAKEEQKASGTLLGEILVASGYVTEWEVAKCMVMQLQLPFIYTTLYDIPRSVVSLLPHAFLHQHRIIPIDLFGKCLVLATAGDISEDVVTEIEESTGYEVGLYVALTSDIQKSLSERFPLEKVTKELSQKFDQLFDGFGGDLKPSD
ncbi:MAG: hypothetical protein V2A76_06200 [Planctomycetota bacterium]